MFYLQPTESPHILYKIYTLTLRQACFGLELTRTPSASAWLCSPPSDSPNLSGRETYLYSPIPYIERSITTEQELPTYKVFALLSSYVEVFTKQSLEIYFWEMKAQQSQKLVFWYKSGPSKSHTTTPSHHIIRDTMII
jgi:hypothetical protein